MEWKVDINKTKPQLPDEIIQYCCQTWLQGTQKQLTGFTEHKRVTPSGEIFRFRAHPSYRSTTGTQSNIWYDWALFDLKINNQFVEYPAQIFCFLCLGPKFNQIDNYHAVVRPFKTLPKNVRGLSILMQGVLDDKFDTYTCESITDNVAVVPNLQHPLNSPLDNQFFVV